MPDLPRPTHLAGAASSVPPLAAGGHGDILRFSIAEDRDGVTVSVEGELDVVTLPDVGLALELAGARGAPVTLDCARLGFADASAGPLTRLFL